MLTVQNIFTPLPYGYMLRREGTMPYVGKINVPVLGRIKPKVIKLAVYENNG
jgi:hypothetical protein